MKNTSFLGVMVCALLLPMPLKADGQVPNGWFQSGTHPQDYEVGTDATVSHMGKTSAYIKNKVEDADGGSGLGQAFRAADYLGKRLRISAYVKTKDIEGWGRLWMRVDAQSNYVSFDNMSDRQIKGTADWTKHEIVLDVPQNSVNVYYGFGLSGKGQMWVDDFRAEVVDPGVPVTKESRDSPATGQTRPAVSESRPVNADFEN
jgi:hypothetical protein